MAPRRQERGDPRALLTDLYQLTMLQAYFDEGLSGEAVFDLYVRRLPERRNYLIACGLSDALDYLQNLAFGPGDLEYLEGLRLFSQPFLDSLAEFRFRGDVYAAPEGTAVFANEPILEIVAPLPQAQLVETYLLNQITLQTMAASKAARVVTAAAGRTVVDFGLRRMHGTDAGMKAARSFYIAGVDATSNVQAGRTYGLPVAGTMAHSYVTAHSDELAAFRAFVSSYPATVLVVDTFDTTSGIENVIRLAKELGEAFQVRAIRLDSGDLAEQAFVARRMLDAAGLQRVEIFASSSLDEYAIAGLVADGAPITGFGVGTRMGVSEDAPYLDSVYKLVAYEGQGRMKLSAEKSTLPHRKQIFRVFEGGVATRDLLAMHDEPADGAPLLRKVMEGGVPAGGHPADLEEARELVRKQLDELPRRLHALEPADPPYEVRISPKLERERRALEGEIRRSSRR